MPFIGVQTKVRAAKLYFRDSPSALNSADKARPNITRVRARVRDVSLYSIQRKLSGESPAPHICVQVHRSCLRAHN